jgi:predicted nucleic acid-binding protein
LNTLFIDTGFIIALINTQDAYHEQAKRLSLKYENYPVITTDAVLLEIGNALSRFAKPQAIEIIQYLQNSKRATVFYVTPDLFAKGLSLYEKYLDKSWCLVDCISFVVMQTTGTTHVLAFDQHFTQAGLSYWRAKS